MVRNELRKPLVSIDKISRPRITETSATATGPRQSTRVSREDPQVQRVQSGKDRFIEHLPREKKHTIPKKSIVVEAKVVETSKQQIGIDTRRGGKEPALLPEDIVGGSKLAPRAFFRDNGVAFPKILLDRFKKYAGCCSLVKQLNKEPSRVAKYLLVNRRLNLEEMKDFDKSGTLSHYLLFLLAKFERDCLLHRKKLPSAELVKPIRPTTDAEWIAAFSQEQARQISKPRRGIKRVRERSEVIRQKASVGKGLLPQPKTEGAKAKSVRRKDKVVRILTQEDYQQFKESSKDAPDMIPARETGVIPATTITNERRQNRCDTSTL